MTEVVVDNGQVFVSEETAIIATEAANRAKQWAEEAEQQANLSADDANLAHDWAVKMDGKVAGEDYSSKYYAQQAADVSVNGVIATGGTTKRSLQDHFGDILNVKDFGAKGDGVTNDSAAFNAAGADVYVPKGEYLIHNLDNINTIQGKGIIYCARTGQRFCADGAVMDKEEIIGYPFFGTGSDQIFTGANRTPQGFAYERDSNGIERLFISIVVDTNEPQQARIVEFRIVNGVMQTDNVAYSNPIHIGHAQGMGVTRERGEIYLWSMSPTDYSVSKIHWRGANTSDSDVQTITLLSSSGRYKYSTVITPTVSADGKYLIGLSKGQQLTYTVMAWDMNDLTVDKVKFAFDIRRTTPETNAIQGICADTKYIYAIEAGWYSKKSIVSKYTYSGNHCEDINMFSGLAPQAGNVISQIEAEGICCYGNSLLTLSKIYEQTLVDVVEWKGYNYACIKNATGIPPYDIAYWTRTTVAANKGTWDDTTSYTAGAIVKNVKVVNKVGDTGTPVYNWYGKNLISYSNTGNVLLPMLRGYNFTILAVTDTTYKKAFDITGSGNTYFYDLNYDATNYSSGWLSNVSNATSQRVVYRGGDSTNQTNTGFLALFGANDTTGDAVRIGKSSKKISIDKNNCLAINTSNDSGIAGQGIIFTRDGTTDKMGSIYSSGSTIHYTGQEYLSLEAIDSSNNIKSGVIIGSTSNTNLPYCAPAQTNFINLGTASRLWKEVFAANATINTSDERLKQDIEDIDERVFRAWEKVDFKQFRFIQAVNEKGENARIHFGVIAQRVKEAFESEGLDGFKYGLLCYDEWEDEYEDIEVTDKPAEYDEEGNVISPAEVHTEKKLVRAAGNAYGIRYCEALALECAYQRWKLEQMQKQLDKILNKDYSDNELTL